MPSKNKGKVKEQRKRAKVRRKLRGKALRYEWIQQNGPCKMCGSWDRIECDHIIPIGKKNKNSVKMWIWSVERRTQELLKCQPLCWSCHRKKSALERRKYEHGVNLYERHGCRCEICVTIFRNYNREQKRKWRQKRYKDNGIPVP